MPATATFLSRIPRIAAALLLVASLGGCVFFSASGNGGGAPGGSASTSDSTEQSTDSGNDDSTQSVCPVGSWQLVNDSWRVALQRIVDESIPGSDVEVSGVLFLDWRGDGSYLLSADRSSAVITGVTDGIPFTQTILHDGTEAGTWSGDGGAYVLAGDASTGYDTSVTLESGGAVYSPDPDDLVADPWSGELAIDCTPAGMSTTVTEPDGTMTVDWVRLG